MDPNNKPVFIVGSVPGQTAEDVFNLVTPEVGDMAVVIADGKSG